MMSKASKPSRHLWLQYLHIQCYQFYICWNAVLRGLRTKVDFSLCNLWSSRRQKEHAESLLKAIPCLDTAVNSHSRWPTYRCHPEHRECFTQSPHCLRHQWGDQTPFWSHDAHWCHKGTTEVRTVVFALLQALPPARSHDAPPATTATMGCLDLSSCTVLITFPLCKVYIFTALTPRWTKFFL